MSLCETETMPSFACQAILFDLDGVLVDSTPCVTRVWKAWAQEHGLDPEYVSHVAHGQRTLRPSAKSRHTSTPSGKPIIEAAGARRHRWAACPAGGKGLLEALPPERYTIVTSGHPEAGDQRLQVVGLPVPAEMITADDVAMRKA